MQTNQMLRKLFSIIPEKLQEEMAVPVRRFYASMKRLKTGGRPSAVEIETEERCTRICDYCPREDGGRMDSSLVKSLINQLGDWKFNGRVSFHGYNEPLLDERLPAFVAQVRTEVPRAAVMLFTNGDLLTRDRVREFERLGVYELRVTFHDQFSKGQERKVRQLAAEYSLVTIMDLREKHRSGILFNRAGLVEIPSSRSMGACYYADMMYVRADGAFTICCNDYNKEVVLGNAHDQPLREVWERPAYAQLRKEIREGKSPLDLCQRCKFSLPSDS